MRSSLVESAASKRKGPRCVAQLGASRRAVRLARSSLSPSSSSSSSPSARRRNWREICLPILSLIFWPPSTALRKWTPTHTRELLLSTDASWKTVVAELTRAVQLSERGTAALAELAGAHAEQGESRGFGDAIRNSPCHPTRRRPNASWHAELRMVSPNLPDTLDFRVPCLH